MRIIAFFAGTALIAAGLGADAPALAHGGRTNSEGCHNDRSNGTYHCHNGSGGSVKLGKAKSRSKAKRNGKRSRRSSLIAPLPLAAFVSARQFVPEGERFTCTAIAVWDGDGPVWCRESPRLRIAGIAAREIDGSCLPGHPCPDASGIAARDALVGLLGGPYGKMRTGHVTIEPIVLRCRSRGDGKRNRTAATCRLPGGHDLAQAMLATGTVKRWHYKGS